MSAAAGDSKPCPYCGESIKLTALKCRFCGEYLQGGPQAAVPPGLEVLPAAEPGDAAMKWVAPIGRTPWAIVSLFLGIFALIPLPFILFVWFPDGQRELLERTMLLTGCISAFLGLMAVVTGIGAMVVVFSTGQKGLVRAILGIFAGIVGGIGNLMVAVAYEAVVKWLGS